VYFDFDKYAIKSDQVQTITDNGKLAATYSNDFRDAAGQLRRTWQPRIQPWPWVSAERMRSGSAWS